MKQVFFEKILAKNRVSTKIPVRIPGSSVVEQLAVNQLVAGSNPAPGATINALFFLKFLGKFHFFHKN